MSFSRTTAVVRRTERVNGRRSHKTSWFSTCVFHILFAFSGFLKSLDMHAQPETHSEMGSEQEGPLLVYILDLVFEREV